MRPPTCNREREWISLALDGELSDFERVLMTEHLDRCADCRAFEASARAVTASLRAAPLEPLETPVSVARPRGVWRGARLRVAPVASAAAAVAAAFVGLASLPERTALDPRGERALVAAPLDTQAQANDLMLELRRPDLAQGKQAILPEVPGGIGAVKPPLAASPSS